MTITTGRKDYTTSRVLEEMASLYRESEDNSHVQDVVLNVMERFRVTSFDQLHYAELYCESMADENPQLQFCMLQARDGEYDVYAHDEHGQPVEI